MVTSIYKTQSREEQNNKQRTNDKQINKQTK